MITDIVIPYEQIRAFCQRHSIRRLALFGSVLRADFAADSDIDVLIEFEADARVTLLDMADMRDELQEIMSREVDLLTPGALSPYFRDEVLAEAETFYEQA